MPWLRQPSISGSAFATLRSVLALLLLAQAPGAVLAAAPCGAWDLVPTPNVGDSVNRLTSITALSPTDAWSVGYWRNEPAGQGPLAMHWNGDGWQQVSLPGTSHLGISPATDGVDAAPNGDVWLVGSVQTSPPSFHLPLLLRWRDGAWDRVQTATLRPQVEYPYGPRAGFAYAVDALAPDDVWAVGLADGYGDASSSSVPLALHWDGSEWTDVEVPLVANRHHELADVEAIASDDVWAVGDYRFIAGAFRGVTYHWDGHAWSYVPSPIEGITQSGLEDVEATAPNEVWALGGSDDGPVLMRWDGSAWSLMPPPPNSGGSLAVIAPDNIWVSGWNGYWHWDGSGWSETPAEVPGASFVIRNGGLEVVGGCDVWSVGFWTLADGITSFTLAERLLASAPSSSDADPLFDAGTSGPAGAAALRLTCANPFRPGNEIRLTLPPAGADASGTAGLLTIHDAAGRTVRRVEFGLGGASGPARFRWDGRSDAGDPLTDGMYFLRLTAGAAQARGKLVLVGGGR